MHYFIIKIPNKQEIQQIAFNHSSDIGFRDHQILTLETLPLGKPSKKQIETIEDQGEK